MTFPHQSQSYYAVANTTKVTLWFLFIIKKGFHAAQACLEFTMELRAYPSMTWSIKYWGKNPSEVLPYPQTPSCASVATGHQDAWGISPHQQSSLTHHLDSSTSIQSI